MVEKLSRNISWPLYLVALLISSLLFVSGIFIGNSLASNVDSALSADLGNLKTRTAELEVLNLIADTNDQCLFYNSQFESFNADTTNFGSSISALEKTRDFGDESLSNLKRDFQLMQTRDFILTQKMNLQCAQQIDTLLYFYKNNCFDCTRQGLVGPSLKKAKSNLMIYAFDSDLNSPVVNALIKKYGISTYPSLVINGKLYSGYLSESEILAKLN